MMYERSAAPFSIERTLADSVKLMLSTGTKYFIAVLRDGRMMTVHAHTYEIEGTHLTFRDPEGLPLYTLAQGTWNGVYAASVNDGSPVCVETLKESDEA
ncbi:MAG: hypothetical protein GEU93_11185 [Propionibacteriales bacterium]|nr:hypothetical protein [Propionibacteriales bacterium]